MSDGPVLVTGAAGFIGFHVTRTLLDAGRSVIGVDSMNAYYDPTLKEARLEEIKDRRGFVFHRLDLADRDRTAELFSAARPRRVVHLAAQAGVRHSLTDPHAYVDANIVAFLNVLEGCRSAAVEHLTYASSSSVYGADTAMPFSTHQGAGHPLSLYGASKRANELMAHCYSHLFALPTTGLRFFTVYGPWGRPDMALFLFTQAILAGKPIKVFNEGRMRRDFTYIDDVVQGVIRASDRIAAADAQWDGAHPDPAGSTAPFRLYNIGNSEPVELLHLIAVLEKELGHKASLELLPMQCGDVPETFADVSELERDVGFRPSTSIEEGVRRFVAWYRTHYGV
jgi:UDP-glucuronate 4-epimerase